MRHDRLVSTPPIVRPDCGANVAGAMFVYIPALRPVHSIAAMHSLHISLDPTPTPKRLDPGAGQTPLPSFVRFPRVLLFDPFGLFGRLEKRLDFCLKRGQTL